MVINKNNSFFIIYAIWIKAFITLLIISFTSIFIFFKVQQIRALNLSNKKIQELNNNLENRVSLQVKEIKKSTMLFEKNI